MFDVEIRFEREDLEGIVPVGSYIGDAIRRFGIRLEGECDPSGNLHDCVVRITRGEELLSPITAAESEHFAAGARKSGERLACQARIERPGEIVVMTQEQKKKEPKTAESRGEQYRKEFAELPLEQKIADLVKLEGIALGETFSFILNSPLKVFEKMGDVMAEFGMKLENKAREAQRPAEHTAETAPSGKTSSSQRTDRKKKDR